VRSKHDQNERSGQSKHGGDFEDFQDMSWVLDGTLFDECISKIEMYLCVSWGMECPEELPPFFEPPTQKLPTCNFLHQSKSFATGKRATCGCKKS